MGGDTLIQFGTARESEPSAETQQSAAGLECPACRQHFSSEARFCPFDGEPLKVALNYDPAADPLLGTVVDQRYRVERVLGEGGMGAVYRVKHVALGKPFALKALRADLATDEDIAERFIGEARTAAAISHPGLVEITDFGKLPDGRPYFVMELLGGEPLSWLLRKVGPLSESRVAAILMQVAEAVSAAHHAGIVHRDIKPDNIHITVTRDGVDHVKVLDFGLAKVMGGARRTRNGVVFGTPHYMSPEQAAGENVDHRADVYSLGVVMYEMLTGRVPFEADSYMGVLSKHIYMQPAPPSALRPGASSVGALEGIVLKSLEKKPRNRYQSFDELLADLEQLVASGLVARPSSPRRSALPQVQVAFELDDSPRRSSTGRGQVSAVWAFAAGLSLVVLGVAGFLLVRALMSPDAAPTVAAPLAPSTQPTARSTVAPVVPPRPVPAASLGSARGAAASAHAAPRLAPLVPPSAAASGSARPSRPDPTPEKPAVIRRSTGVRGEIVDPWAN
jgi:serine/threonine-protein kinase